MIFDPAPFPTRLRLTAVVLLSLILLPAMAAAQLVDATWLETVNVNADSNQQNVFGSDQNVPEPQSATVSGFTYNMSGNVSFTSPGPPNAAAHVNGSYTSGLSSFFGGSAFCQIDFQVLVVETSPPPITLQNVRIRVQTAGSVSADGDSELFANATATFRMWTVAQPDLLVFDVIANNSQGSASDSFDEDVLQVFGPAGGANVTLTVSAAISGEGLVDNTQATADAFIDPVFSIDTAIIPGGDGSTYADHYEVQVSPGFWALGNTPVKASTWGRIKKMYGN